MDGKYLIFEVPEVEYLLRLEQDCELPCIDIHAIFDRVMFAVTVPQFNSELLLVADDFAYGEGMVAINTMTEAQQIRVFNVILAVGYGVARNIEALKGYGIGPSPFFPYEYRDYKNGMLVLAPVPPS